MADDDEPGALAAQDRYGFDEPPRARITVYPQEPELNVVRPPSPPSPEFMDALEAAANRDRGDRLMPSPSVPGMGMGDLARMGGTAATRLAPSAYSLARGEPAPPIANLPEYGKVPSTADPRYASAVGEAGELGQNFLPMGGAAKATAAAVPFLGLMARRPQLMAAPDRIVGAAYRIGDRNFAAPVHSMAAEDAMSALGVKREMDLIDRQPGANLSEKLAAHRDAQGFVTSSGRFLTREEAQRFAADAGQIRAGAPGRISGLNAEDISGQVGDAARAENRRIVGELAAQDVLPEAMRRQDVVRDRSGRPIRTAPLPIGAEQDILEAGLRRVSEPERIVGAAVKGENRVFAADQHWGAANEAGRYYNVEDPIGAGLLKDVEHDGFLTNKGRYVDRQEALRIAQAAGQSQPGPLARQGRLETSETRLRLEDREGREAALAAINARLGGEPQMQAAARRGRQRGRMGEIADLSTYEPPPPIGHNMPPEPIPLETSNLNPLANERVTFRGKEPAQMTPDEITAWGEHYGVKDLGKQSAPQTFHDVNGNPFQIPGGLEGKWTHADLLSMKANPINPANIDRGLHIQMQQKLGRTMTPDEVTPAHIWNGLVFGMTSPNNPLFPNQMAASRLRLRTPEMIDDLASMIPWQPGEEVSKQARKLVSDQIAARFGLQGEPKGGLGARGTADYSRVGEMAQLFKQNPDFFRKKPDETWLQAVERIGSQTKGLSMKTGSFGMVWQDPATAGISAIDRHMARLLHERGGLFLSPAEEAAWQNQSVGRWNKRENDRVIEEIAANRKLKPKDRQPVAPADTAENFDDLVNKSGADGFMGEMLLDHVGKSGDPKFRYATGQINPNLPPHLAQAQWVREPEKVLLAGRAYLRALNLNQQIANESGLPLFMSQWMEWDRIRNRFEPHENMFPGLERLPAQSMEQLRAVDVAHRQTGHKTYGKQEEGNLQPTRPYAGNPFQMGLYGLGGATVLAPHIIGGLADNEGVLRANR